jgi:glycerophosphoryl diester phosphodiesterase
MPTPEIYAHRGGAALRPENTVAAFDHGLSLGADGLELDVHLSQDGVVVVHHDATLERTTNGRGPLAACSADELERLDAGYTFRAEDDGGCPYRGQGIRIPRLAAVLARYAGVPLIVELKSPAPALALGTIADVRAARAIERVVIGSFHRLALQTVREQEPRLRTGSSREETRWALYRSRLRVPLRRAPFQEFQVPEAVGQTTVVTPRFVRDAHRAGLPVKVWTVNEADDMRRLVSWGVDGLITDRPDVAVRTFRLAS